MVLRREALNPSCLIFNILQQGTILEDGEDYGPVKLAGLSRPWLMLEQTQRRINALKC